MRIIPKKSLGQHFLNSKHVLEQIINTANIQNGEKILEIGPGTGVLTEALLQTGANVIAIEKDTQAHTFLEIKFDKEIRNGQLGLILGDILDENIVSSLSLLDNDYALVANIPYYITGAILQKFLENEPRPNRMVLLVQREVAERIVAKNNKESILSISVKAFGTPRIVTKVPKGAFSPPPKVDSAILSIENISKKHFTDKNIEIPKFFEIVRHGFAHKRKFTIRNLEKIISSDKLDIIWSRLKLDKKVRAEDISLEQWLEITKEVEHSL